MMNDKYERNILNICTSKYTVCYMIDIHIVSI